ncbi:MAG: biotin carboxylase N-terminal domain-containing protein [Pseudomonadota bacterium]
MFERILIANRGEIAVRVIRTARRMGIKCVAVYSEADADALHVAMADTAVAIGPAPAAESYLCGDRIIAAALEAGAQAIHPGYGFLSENPEFVDEVEAAGLTFIGPPAQAIRAMGLKDAAKALMEQAGVPVVPGYHGADQTPGLLAEEASAIGYPVLIKAVAGGGGKGMRLVEAADAFLPALDAARSEAEAAFGNPAVLIEKFIAQPRHIEMQVFGDGEDAIHLYERDCSLQRRHQKVIEEAPAPGMTAEVRSIMGAAAVHAAKAIGYSGAGTVEFIVDGSGPLRPDGFWFMEMNTRLQVEHPVTEAITGIDLVEWQLRVAAGESLPLAQDEIAISGHAFEARLYAEDVAAGFLPATGTLSHLRFPDGARADSGVRSGDTISPYYDPMIAKIVTHGTTRPMALRRLTSALEATEIAGTVTNLSFLRALTRHEGFANGTVDTGLIARDLEVFVAVPAPSARDWAIAALAGLGLLERGDWLRGFALWGPLLRRETLRLGVVECAVSVEVLGPEHHRVNVQGEYVDVVHRAGRWQIESAEVPAWFVSGRQVTLFGSTPQVLELVDPLDRHGAEAQDRSVIDAPMPGLVKTVYVETGQAVAAGDRLAVLEAMKMEHQMTAPRDGVVAEVLTAAGAQVEAGAALIRLEEVDE